VVIEIKAFGINHAEMHMHRGEWAEAAPVSGIECVGLVKSCPGGASFRLVRNSKVQWPLQRPASKVYDVGADDIRLR
jgi:D-arabinose 1-dehydrogenase-like Zn-dependent alcohol dehydrogenase